MGIFSQVIKFERENSEWFVEKNSRPVTSAFECEAHIQTLPDLCNLDLLSVSLYKKCLLVIIVPVYTNSYVNNFCNFINFGVGNSGYRPINLLLKT